jgi:hypothetical protein
MKKDYASNEKKKTGRKPKEFPAIHRYDIRLNETDNIRFETMFHLSGYKYPTHFIRDKVLNSSLKVIVTDKTRTDFVIKLSQFRGELSRIGNNYNQLLRLLKAQLGEKKALAFLYKLEKATIELVNTHREIELYIQKLEEEWLR